MTPEPSLTPPTVDQAVQHWANRQLELIEEREGADVITIISPIFYGLEHSVRVAVEAFKTRRKKLLVILDTSGGIVEVVERIVRVFREHYREVVFLVPDRAMSAGTVLVMSGDAILMDYHSVLGPIDPQVERDGKLVPALSYLAQFKNLSERAKDEELTTADVVLLQKLDLAELHQFELAKKLSISLLKQWLTEYKFKDWKKTETRGVKVTKKMREERAEEIADALSDHERWQTHGRGIDRATLTEELNLKIDDYGEDEKLRQIVWDYFWFLKDHMRRSGYTSLVHSREFMGA